MDFKKIGVSSPQQLFNFMKKNLNYGFTFKGKVFTDDKPDFNDNMNKFYKLRVGEDFIKSGYGVCWDFCEFERLFFEQFNIPHECYFIVNFLTREQGGPTHTFLLFNKNNLWYWIEYAWFNYRGIWQYNSKQEALSDIIDKFMAHNAKKYDHTELYKTSKVNKRLNTFSFCEHCFNGEKLDINKFKIKK